MCIFVQAEQEKEERYSERLRLLKQQRHWKRQKRKVFATAGPFIERLFKEAV